MVPFTGWLEIFLFAGIVISMLYSAHVLSSSINSIFIKMEQERIWYIQETELLKSKHNARIDELENAHYFAINGLKKTHQEELDAQRKRYEQKAIQSKSVIRGTIAEQLFPLSVESPYSLGDMRFLGQPFDYIVFEGYSENRIDNVVFLEFKTGTSQLSPIQKALKSAVEEGKVTWRTVHHE